MEMMAGRGVILDPALDSKVTSFNLPRALRMWQGQAEGKTVVSTKLFHTIPKDTSIEQ